jgi:hypothetical protein
MIYRWWPKRDPGDVLSSEIQGPPPEEMLDFFFFFECMRNPRFVFRLAPLVSRKTQTKPKYCNKIYARISNGWLAGLPKILAVPWTSQLAG